MAPTPGHGRWYLPDNLVFEGPRWIFCETSDFSDIDAPCIEVNIGETGPRIVPHFY